MLSLNRDRSFLGILQTVLQDLHFSLKLFFSNPKFALVAVFTLGLGIAVNATVFSWIDRVLLHPYPGVDTHRLALIETVTLTRESVLLTLPGMVVGIAVAIVVLRFFGSMLVGVSPTDPLTFGAAAVFLIVVSLLASYLPARRALRIDPIVALRCP